MKILLEDCTTVMECIVWADQEWPNFWKFATQKPLTQEEQETLLGVIQAEEEKFKRFTEKLLVVGRIDKSKEALALLISGAGSLTYLERNKK